MAAADMETGRQVENDLRLTIPDRKRVHEEISQDNDLINFSNSTPQKRPKRSNESELPETKGSDTGEDRNDVHIVAPSSSENPDHATVSGSPRLGKEIGAAPSMNWNLGTKAKIRTSLGGGLGKANGQEKGQQEKAKALSKIQSRGQTSLYDLPKEYTSRESTDGIIYLETKKTRRRLDNLHKRLAAFDHVNSKFRRLQNRIYEAEVDHNYCLFYPLDRDYESLFQQGQEGVSENGDEDGSVGKEKGKLGGPKPPLWQLVVRCMETGKLEDLKSGKVGEIPHTDDPWPLLEADTEHTTQPEKTIVQDLTRPDSVNFGTLKVYVSGQKTLSANPTTSEPHTSGICKAIEDANIPNVDNRIFTVKLSPEPQKRPGVHGQESHTKPEPGSSQDVFHEKEPHHDQKSDQSQNLEQDQDQDSENDGGVVLNLQTSEQESGEVSESNSQAPNDDEENSMVVDEPNDDSISEDDEDEGGDAMMGYARSDAVADGNEDNSESIRRLNNQPRTLAELSPEELKAQLRYFHITKRPSDVDRDTFVRCLVCAQECHMAEACVKLTCTVCGTHGDHFSQQCPQNKKCSKCRELGHNKGNCPYKLKHLAPAEIVCDLCQRKGHFEEDCELLWRTSGQPWESDLVNRNVRLSCYECGKSGHLGNDCPTRRPGKPFGTSTWSLHSRGQFTIKSEGEMTIKGRAQQQKAITIDESDDEQANFYRPKIPEPARKGQIRIMTGSSQNFSNRQHDLYTPGGPLYRTDKSGTSRGGDYWDKPRNEGDRNDPGKRRYRPGGRRSLSPRYAEPAPGRGNNNFNSLPRRIQERPPPRGGGIPVRGRGGGRGVSYRPMPSAAQNAWSKHRT